MALCLSGGKGVIFPSSQVVFVFPLCGHRAVTRDGAAGTVLGTGTDRERPDPAPLLPRSLQLAAPRFTFRKRRLIANNSSEDRCVQKGCALEEMRNIGHFQQCSAL